MTVERPQIDRTACPAARAEHVEPWRSSRGAAQIVGDRGMSRPVARRRFDRSATSSASRRAATVRLQLVRAGFDVEPSYPDAHLASIRKPEVDPAFFGPPPGWNKCSLRNRCPTR